MADVTIFTGRLHPLLVHLPIGLVLLAAFLRWWPGGSPARRHAASPVLLLGVMAAALACGTGLLLRKSGDVAGDLVDRHQLGGLLTTGVLLAAWALDRMAGRRERFRLLAGLTLLSGVVCVGLTGHDGGSLTHGEDYLTKYLPLQASATTEQDADPGLYQAVIQPILEDHCTSCHCEEKAKGGLRLDSYACLMRGGTNQPTIVAGDAGKGELMHRVTLPPDDDDVMPPDGRKPLAPGDVELLRYWIASGASPSQTVFAGGGPPAELLPALSVRLPALAARRERQKQEERAAAAAVATDVATLRRELGLCATPVSRDDALLAISTFSRPQEIGDAEALRLAPLAAAVARMDLSGTRIGDAGLSALGRFHRLESLNLAQTRVTETGLVVLASFPALRVLNLYGVPLGPASVDALARVPGLAQVYLSGTGLPADSIARLRQLRPDMTVVGNEPVKGPAL